MAGDRTGSSQCQTCTPAQGAQTLHEGACKCHFQIGSREFHMTQKSLERPQIDKKEGKGKRNQIGEGGKEKEGRKDHPSACDHHNVLAALNRLHCVLQGVHIHKLLPSLGGFFRDLKHDAPHNLLDQHLSTFQRDPKQTQQSERRHIGFQHLCDPDMSTCKRTKKADSARKRREEEQENPRN